MTSDLMSLAQRALLSAFVFAVAFLTSWLGLSGEFVNWDEYDKRAQ